MTEEAKDWEKIHSEHEEVEALEADEDFDFDEEDSAESTLEGKLAEAEAKAAENLDKFVRVTAEMDNLRRRLERDVTKAHKYGTEKFVQNLLPVVDSLEQAIQLAETHGDKSMHEGLELTMKLLLDMLKKSDVEQIDPLGEAFNPELHEAMSMQEDKDAKPNTVITVFQKGYKLNDRVIRAARVIVSK